MRNICKIRYLWLLLLRHNPMNATSFSLFFTKAKSAISLSRLTLWSEFRFPLHQKANLSILTACTEETHLNRYLGNRDQKEKNLIRGISKINICIYNYLLNWKKMLSRKISDEYRIEYNDAIMTHYGPLIKIISNNRNLICIERSGMLFWNARRPRCSQRTTIMMLIGKLLYNISDAL